MFSLSLAGLLVPIYPSETPLPQIIAGFQGSGSRLNVSEGYLSAKTLDASGYGVWKYRVDHLCVEGKGEKSQPSPNPADSPQ